MVAQGIAPASALSECRAKAGDFSAAPDFPERFGCLEDSRAHCKDFFDWYNLEHHHTGVGLFTPRDVHHGLAEERFNARTAVLNAAHRAHPERFSEYVAPLKSINVDLTDNEVISFVWPGGRQLGNISAVMTWLAISFFAVCTLYAFVVRRVAVETGRASIAWPVLGFCAGPLVLPVLLALTPQTATRRTVRPLLLILVGLTLVVGGAVGVTSVFLKTVDPRPEKVVAQANVDGMWAPTELDGPTSFAIAMLVAGATLVAGMATGGLGGLMMTPPVALAIERAVRSDDNQPIRPPGRAGDSSTESARNRFTRACRKVLQIATGLGSAALLLFAVWLCIFGAPLSGAFVSVAALTTVLCSLRAPVAMRARMVLIPALILSAFLFWKTPVREFQSTLQRLRDKKEQTGPNSFSTGDKLGVYGLNVIIGLGGFAAGFPEVAKETIYLTLQGPSTRTWHSDFAMRSPKVRAEIRKLIEFAENQGKDEDLVTLPMTRITWSQYSMNSDSARVALALNSPLEVIGTAHREGTHWRLELVGRARAEYPRRSILLLFSLDGKRVELDEGLFWVLQESGWLHPYIAEWRWSVLSNDPRLQNLRTPFLSFRERFLAWVLPK